MPRPVAGEEWQVGGLPPPGAFSLEEAPACGGVLHFRHRGRPPTAWSLFFLTLGLYSTTAGRGGQVSVWVLVPLCSGAG
jgi:hypothetical protein